MASADSPTFTRRKRSRYDFVGLCVLLLLGVVSSGLRFDVLFHFQIFDIVFPLLVSMSTCPECTTHPGCASCGYRSSIVAFSRTMIDVAFSGY